jgi:SepF-like predicted cell division protein (DUF552 family)
MTVTLGKRKPIIGPHSHEAKEEQYIDLGTMSFEGETSGEHAGSQVKVAEIYRFEDLKILTKLLYDGHSIIIDYSSLANDELAMKKIIQELHSVVDDTKGDVAGIGHNMLIATSAGLKIDRSKIRGSY